MCPLFRSANVLIADYAPTAAGEIAVGRAAQNGHFWRRILCQVVCWALEAFGQPLAGDGGMRGLEGADRWQALRWWPKRAFGEIAGQGADQCGHGVRAGRAARP
jgi:hypothetical protein